MYGSGLRGFCGTMGGMEQADKNLRLRGTSGEYARKWLLSINLASKKGIAHHSPLSFEDAERHPENYVFIPNFTDVEDSAGRFLTLEIALQHQRILKREGIETKLA
jgi:hypothetical protein